MANIITCFRILCSIMLVFFPISSVQFFITYMFCGLTDVMDGIVARKTNTVSDFGAKLDTGADFIFVIVLLIKILLVIDVPVWLWIWVIAIAGIKIGNVIYAFIYMGRFIVEHTIMNKVTGILLFLLPLTVFFVEMKYSVMAVCSIATFSAIQEGYYIKEGREIV